MRALISSIALEVLGALALGVLASGAALAAPPAASPQTKPAPQVSPGPAPSRQGRALSRALVPQKTWEGLLDRSAESLSGAVARSLSAHGEKVPGDLQSSLRKELGNSLKYDEAVDAQAQALQKRFSPEELEQAARFYESPLGRKMLEQLPAAQGEVGDQLQERLAAVVPDVIHRVAPSAMNGAGGGASSSPARPSPETGTGAGADAGEGAEEHASPPAGGTAGKAPPGKGL